MTIDGPAGAGKTTLSEILKSELRMREISTEVIHMDDLYDGWENALGIKLEQALQDIECQTQGDEIVYPIYNWQQMKYSRIKSIPTPRILILEGVGAGQSGVRDRVDLSIWVDIDPDEGISRAISRDGQSIAAYMQSWKQAQELHFAEHHTRQSATFTVVMD